MASLKYCIAGCPVHHNIFGIELDGKGEKCDQAAECGRWAGKSRDLVLLTQLLRCRMLVAGLFQRPAEWTGL